MDILKKIIIGTLIGILIFIIVFIVNKRNQEKQKNMINTIEKEIEMKKEEYLI